MGRGRWARALLLGLAGAVSGVVTAAAAAVAQPVQVPSLDRAGGAPVLQPGHWFAAPGAGRAPAMLLLHGCGGALAADGQHLSARMTEYAALLNAQGVHVLVTDSLTPRGERELCTQRIGQRRVTQTQRRRDALGALQWLAARPEVQPQRIGLLGWSHGGSAVLATIDRSHPEVAAAAVAPALAVAFYPGCSDAVMRGWLPGTALLMLVGESDDWTPAEPCRVLAARAAEPQPLLVSYPGAFHGFDSSTAVRLRRDVPNGVVPGQGVHVGGDPAARAASRERLLQFVRQRLGL